MPIFTLLQLILLIFCDRIYPLLPIQGYFGFNKMSYARDLWVLLPMRTLCIPLSPPFSGGTGHLSGPFQRLFGALLTYLGLNTTQSLNVHLNHQFWAFFFGPKNTQLFLSFLFSIFFKYIRLKV